MTTLIDIGKNLDRNVFLWTPEGRDIDIHQHC